MLFGVAPSAQKKRFYGQAAPSTVAIFLRPLLLPWCR
jgi:hypothetical protein